MSFDPQLAYRLSLASYYDLSVVQRLEQLEARLSNRPGLSQGTTHGRMYEFDTGRKIIAEEGDDAMVTETPSHIIVLFRGTQYELDEGKDAKIVPTASGGQHKGYYAALTDSLIRPEKHPSLMQRLIERLDQSDKPIIFSGVSRGGALAQMMAVAYAQHERDTGKQSRIEALYTFGQPMAGDAAFAATTRQLLGGRYFRVTMNDPVTHMPPIPEYQHAVEPVRLGIRVDLEQSVASFRPNYTYSACVSDRPKDKPAITQEAQKLWENHSQAVSEIFGDYGFAEQIKSLTERYPNVANHFIYVLALHDMQDKKGDWLRCDDAQPGETRAAPVTPPVPAAPRQR